MTDDGPRTEEEWEEFLNVLRARTARLGDLFRTLFHHPDRNRIIDSEMGWGPSLSSIPSKSGPGLGLEGVEAFAASPGAGEGAQVAGVDVALAAIPAYMAAKSLADSVCGEVVRGVLFKYRDADESRVPEQCDEIDAALRPFANIWAELKRGHDLGYDARTICGNVAYCRRAMKVAEECSGVLWTLADDGTLDDATVASLRSRLKGVQEAIQQRISDLRAQADAP